MVSIIKRHYVECAAKRNSPFGYGQPDSAEISLLVTSKADNHFLRGAFLIQQNFFIG